VNTFEKPVQWREWLRSEKVNYLGLSLTREILLSMLREEIGSDRQSDWLNKSELAHVCLKSGVVPCN